MPFTSLWFDVGIKRYTTIPTDINAEVELWFDVGIKRYTTRGNLPFKERGCGLMQESKDIQHFDNNDNPQIVVV